MEPSLIIFALHPCVNAFVTLYAVFTFNILLLLLTIIFFCLVFVSLTVESITAFWFFCFVHFLCITYVVSFCSCLFDPSLTTSSCSCCFVLVRLLKFTATTSSVLSSTFYTLIFSGLLMLNLCCYLFLFFLVLWDFFLPFQFLVLIFSLFVLLFCVCIMYFYLFRCSVCHVFAYLNSCDSYCIG